MYEIPGPDDIAEQFASDIEEELRTAPDGSTRTIDARSPRSVLAAIGRVTGLALYSVYLYLSWVLKQLFPDSCDDAVVPIHARIWGIDRLPAAFAVGHVDFAGAEGTVIAAGTRLTLSGGLWRTTATVTIDGDETVRAPVRAVTAGATGNSTAGAKLALVTPIVGLSGQVATVSPDGIGGGLDLESISSWRGRVLDRIRQPPDGGARHDYVDWVKKALPAAGRITVHPNWVGPGSVGVAFAIADPIRTWRAPTVAEVAVVQTYLGTADAPGVAPVTAEAIALAAIPRAIDVTARISPYSVTVKSAVEAAAAAWFGTGDNQIAGTLHLSRLRERLSRAAGEDWHTLAAPTGEQIQLGPREIAIPGTVAAEEAT